MLLAQALDYASVFVFALTGALTASRARLDLGGFIFIAALTAVGGGTVRDVILDRTPVFWVAEPSMLVVSTIAALVVFVTAHRLESRRRAILWLDALALSVAVAAGVGAASKAGAPWLIVIAMGMMTGSLGGLARDVICNEVPLVLRDGELYVTAAMAGGIVALATQGLGPVPSAMACGLTVFGLRAGALMHGWHLPRYRPRR